MQLEVLAHFAAWGIFGDWGYYHILGSKNQPGIIKIYQDFEL